MSVGIFTKTTTTMLKKYKICLRGPFKFLQSLKLITSAVPAQQVILWQHEKQVNSGASGTSRKLPLALNFLLYPMQCFVWIRKYFEWAF